MSSTGPLERVTLHQTRLRTPGLFLDPSGVALGTHALVLFAGLERLVAFLSAYTREHVFSSEMGPPLLVWHVRSPLGHREIVAQFAAISTAQVDAVGEIARLTGGLTFIGSERHFVQYRDSSAPFGYDAVELLAATEHSALALHHSTFTQSYARERQVDLTQLALRLDPVREPKSVDAAQLTHARPLWVTVQPGLAAALVGYLTRHGVRAEVTLVELPSTSALQTVGTTLYLLRIAALPERLVQLLTKTPGLRAFVPVAPGVAVEGGHRHPWQLSTLGLFPADGLTLLPARRPNEPRWPLVVPRLPAMAAIDAVTHITLDDDALEAGQPSGAHVGRPLSSATSVSAPAIDVCVRLVPSSSGARRTAATVIPSTLAPLLRRLAHVMPRSMLKSASLASVSIRHGLAPHGSAASDTSVLVLLVPEGVEALPLGRAFVEQAPRLMVLAGHDLSPPVPAERLTRTVQAPAGAYTFVECELGERSEHLRIWCVGGDDFVPLADALLVPESWGARVPVEVADLGRAELHAELPEVTMGSLGLLPLSGLR